MDLSFLVALQLNTANTQDVDVQGSLNSKQLDKSSPKMLSSSIGLLFGFLCYDRGSILM